jgi:hypothetical protein
MQQAYFYALTMLALALPVVFGRRRSRLSAQRTSGGGLGEPGGSPSAHPSA